MKKLTAESFVENTKFQWSEYFRYVSLISLIFILMNDSTFPPYTRILALTALVFSVVFNSIWLWPTMFVVALITFLTGSIWTYDNHEWAVLYWILTLALFSFVRKDELLQKTSQYLIGLIFLFATGWKIASEEFRTAAFFEFTGNTESRITQVMTRFDLMPLGINSNNEKLGRWRNPEIGLDPFTLLTSDALEFFWSFLTYATYVVEGGLALLFLLPLVARWQWLRDAALALFFVGTYILVPVSGFGNLLACMGFAASTIKMKQRMYLYAGLIVLLEIIPTRMLILDFLQIGT